MDRLNREWLRDGNRGSGHPVLVGAGPEPRPYMSIAGLRVGVGLRTRPGSVGESSGHFGERLCVGLLFMPASIDPHLKGLRLLSK